MNRFGVWMMAALPLLGVAPTTASAAVPREEGARVAAATSRGAAGAPLSKGVTARGVAAAPARGASTGRLGGATRYDTAASSAVRPRDGHPIAAITLVSGLDPMRAAAVAGPEDAVFYVPPRGVVPRSVRAAIAGITGVPVRASGTKAALPDAQVRAAIGTRTFTRIARGTAEANRQHDSFLPPEYNEPYDRGFVTQASLPTALAGLQSGASLVPQGPGEDTPTEYDWRDYANPQDVIGGIAGLTPWQHAWLLKQIQAPDHPGETTLRDAPADVYGRSARAALTGFPKGSATVFLAEGEVGVDAAPTLRRYDGPVLLVPRCGALPQETRDALARLRPERVVAIGDTTSVCDATLRAAAAASTPLRRRAVDLAGDYAVTTAHTVVALADPGATVPMSEPITALAGPVYGPAGLWVRGPQPIAMYALGASGRVWTWAEGHPETRTVVAAWGRNVTRLASGPGVPCAVLRNGTTSCLWTSAATAKAVTIPGAPRAATFAVDGPALAITDRSGRPYLWTRYRGKLSVLKPKGLPSRVKAIELADTNLAYSLTSDGVLRQHSLDGRSPATVVLRGVRTLYPGGGGDAVSGSTSWHIDPGYRFANFPALTHATVARWSPLTRRFLTTDGRVWEAGDTHADPMHGFGG